jgi:molybdenum cofactor biosynthesis protein B
MMTRKKHLKHVNVSAGIITVSSTRTPETDLSGMTIRSILDDAGIKVRYYGIIPDRVEAIRSEVFKAVQYTNCLIINGGTGLTPDDCTIEAVLPLLDKKIDGFGELFRMKSFQEIGNAAMLSRAIAGILYGKVIFCIPGSVPAVTLATKELIIQEIVHILSHTSG